MLEDDFSDSYRIFYRNVTSGIAVVPFSFGNFPLIYDQEKGLTGNILYQEIADYWNELPQENSWPCWEMNDHDAVKGIL